MEENCADYGCCRSCHLVLHDPFIECQDCSTESDTKTYICLECYSKGKEFGTHKSYHAYSVVKQDFSLFASEWSAKEELRLLDAVLHHGLGNWEEIRKYLPRKSASECEEHFQDFFIDDKEGEFALVSSNFKERFRRDRPIPYVQPQKEQSLLFQIRPPSSLSSKELAGYNPARGDFESEYDDFAEAEINSIQYDELAANIEKSEDRENDDYLYGQLELASIEVYNDKLRERRRRKIIVKEHGLLNKRASVGLSSTKYPLISGSNSKYSHLFDLRRLLCSFDFDYLLESIQHEFQLRQRIRDSQEFRNNGLKSLSSAAVYKKLKCQRESYNREISNETVRSWVTDPRNICYVKDRSTGKMIPTTNARKQAGPLNIVGLPCYEKLCPNERELCSEIRITPENFLQIKSTMIAECQKSKGLRLADARPVVKIDVNKTRKIYDCLINKGVIYKTSSKTA